MSKIEYLVFEEFGVKFKVPKPLELKKVCLPRGTGVILYIVCKLLCLEEEQINEFDTE